MCARWHFGCIPASLHVSYRMQTRDATLRPRSMHSVHSLTVSHKRETHNSGGTEPLHNSYLPAAVSPARICLAAAGALPRRVASLLGRPLFGRVEWRPPQRVLVLLGARGVVRERVLERLHEVRWVERQPDAAHEVRVGSGEGEHRRGRLRPVPECGGRIVRRGGRRVSWRVGRLGCLRTIGRLYST